MKTFIKQIVTGVVLVILAVMLPNGYANADGEKYLTFTAMEDNSSVMLCLWSYDNLEFRRNNQEWGVYDGSNIELRLNETVQFRGTDVKTDFGKHFKMTGKIAASGSVTSLTDRLGNSADVKLSERCYEYMFADCDALIRAPELPAVTLADYCYQSMFENCSSLTEAPSLPAVTLAYFCYNRMFKGCTSLVAAPKISAINLAGGCCTEMFKSCSSLTTAPALPATNLANNCYWYMFEGCSALTEAPALPATTLSQYCYSGMFAGCTALTEAPVLPANSLEEGCYCGMFSNCKALTEAPALPATKLENGCYSRMFSYCYSLETIPVLHATTLADYCYQNMFTGCFCLEVTCDKYESAMITDEFVLPETTKQKCYEEMFTGVGLYYVDEKAYIPKTPESNVTYYCKYSRYNISYELNGGIDKGGNPLKYVLGVGVSAFNQPDKDGYSFDGWYFDPEFTKKADSISMIQKGDVTLYAKWVKNPYTETISAKNTTYEVDLDSNDNVTAVKLTEYSGKNATKVTISTVEYNNSKINVTEICDNAFANNKKIKSITIGDSVTSIGKSAFSGCSALRTVNIGNNVKEIKDKAFYKCSALATVTGGKNVSSIGASAFFGCKKLKSITLSTKLTTIGTAAFANCKALNKVTLNSKVAFVGAKAFKGCTALKTVTIKTTKLTTKNVGKEAFGGINSKATVKVPKNKLSAYKKLLKKVGVTKKTQKIKK